MDAATLAALLPPGSLFGRNIQVLDRADSTNTRLKLLAAEGAPEGTVVLAAEQTAGRGTRDRAFFSPRGQGLYLSLLLRPRVPPEQLLTLTGRTAVAVRGAIEAACGAPADIKWLNDILIRGRKVCGILAEPAPDLSWVVVGMGVNLTQTPEDFLRAGLPDAASLASEGFPVPPGKLAAAILAGMEEMYRTFPHQPEAWLEEYRRRCITPGRAISFSLGGQRHTGTALGIDDSFALTANSGGRPVTLFSGDVTLL